MGILPGFSRNEMRAISISAYATSLKLRGTECHEERGCFRRTVVVSRQVISKSFSVESESAWRFVGEAGVGKPTVVDGPRPRLPDAVTVSGAAGCSGLHKIWDWIRGS